MGWKDDTVVKGWEQDEVVSAPGAVAKELTGSGAGLVRKAKIFGSHALGSIASMATGGQDRPGVAEGVVEIATGKAPKFGAEGAAGRRIQAEMTQPRTTAEKYIAAAGSGVGGMAFPVPGVQALGPVRSALVGTSSGLSGEVAGQATATKESPEGSMLARTLASLLGGGATAVPGANVVSRPQLVRGAQSTMEAAGVDGMNAGVARAGEASRTLGVPVLPTQGLPNPTPAQGLVADLARNSETAGKVHQVLNAQPEAGVAKLRAFIDTMGAKDAQGRPVAPGQGQANQVRDAAIREVAERPVEKAQAASRQGFREGAQEALPAEVRFSAPAEVKAVQDTMRVLEKSDAGRAFRNKYKGLIEESAILDKSGKPFVKIAGEPLELYNFRKELSKLAQAGLKDTATGADITKSVGYLRMTKALDDLLKEHAPALTAANDKFARSMKANADPMRQGPLGQALPKGSDAAKAPAQWEQLNTVLGNPDKFSSTDVRTTARALSRSNPKAFPNLVRQHMESRLEPLSTSGRNASTREISEAVFGQPGSRQRENTLTAVEESARAQGQSPAAARKAAEALADALVVVSHDRGGVGALTETAGRSIIGGVGLRGPWLGARGLRFGEGEFNHKQVLEALLAPDAGERLQKVASFSLARNRVRAAAGVGKATAAAINTED